MMKISTTKKKPLHQKQKRTSKSKDQVVVTTNRNAKSRKYIDVTDKSRIVVIKGDRVAEQAALIALRAELSEITESFSVSISNDTRKNHKQTKHFGLRWISNE